MKGRFISDLGNPYDNFQMMAYVDAGNSKDAVTDFFDQTPFPIRWEDVEYLWAEQLADHPEGATTGIMSESTLSPFVCAITRVPSFEPN